MDPHPDFADTDLPRAADLGAFRLTPLAPENTQEDFEAVMASAGDLAGLFGSDWPAGLTLGANRIDLAWHEREFTARRSFAWIVRDRAGRYLGCAYLYPALGRMGFGKVYTWMISMPDREILHDAFRAAFEPWLQPYLPADYQTRWIGSP